MMFVLVHLAKNVSGDSKTNFILCFDELRSHIEFVHIFEMSIALLRPQNTLRMQSFDRNRGCIGLYLAFMPLVGFVAWQGKTKNFDDKMRKSFDASSCEKRCVEKTTPFRDHESWQSGECRPLATHLGRLRANPRRGKLANMIRFQDQDLYCPASTSTVSSISTWIKFLSFFLLYVVLHAKKCYIAYTTCLQHNFSARLDRLLVLPSYRLHDYFQHLLRSEGSNFALESISIYFIYVIP